MKSNRSVVAVALAVLAAAIGLAVAPLAARATFPPPPGAQNGRIAATVVTGNNHEIFSMKANGRDPINLTNHPAHDANPSYSPDGEKIAFDSDRAKHERADIYVMDSDGSDVVRLTNMPGLDQYASDPTFSPDGQQIAFTALSDEPNHTGSEIYAVNVNGGPVTRLTNTNHVSELRPAFSPDGRIAFVSNRDGNLEIYIMNSDGSGQTRLTSNGVGPRNLGPSDDTPSFSPDGSEIVYNRDGQIRIMGADGSASVPLSAPGVTGIFPTFSPDGTKIAFKEGTGGIGGAAWGITVMKADGSDPVSLPANEAGSLGTPDWQPAADTDGDGLTDYDERFGINADDDPEIEVDLPAMGADPMRKDIFIEIDSMVPHGFLHGAAEVVQRAFLAAPTAPNPDGSTGISLHIDAGRQSLMNPVTNQRWGSLSRSDRVPHVRTLGSLADDDTYVYNQFDALKAQHFGEGRLGVFHYALSIHAHPDGGTLAGESRDVPASDIIIADGSNCVNTRVECTMGFNEQALTLMHELGHNLGLQHSGPEAAGVDPDTNFNPNHFSIMNYAFLAGIPLDHNGDDKQDGLRLSYSRHDSSEVPPLNEAGGLNEALGVQESADRIFSTFFFCGRTADPKPTLTNAPANFNCRGSNQQNNVRASINNDDKYEVLRTYDEWAQLDLAGSLAADQSVAGSPARSKLVEFESEDWDLTREENLQDFERPRIHVEQDDAAGGAVKVKIVARDDVSLTMLGVRIGRQAPSRQTLVRVDDGKRAVFKETVAAGKRVSAVAVDDAGHLREVRFRTR